ncbi:MAG: hypothetical protein COV66_09700 [Nitrospinae bacterium CG11_big_fil_rev_8_21_14_0_20_45_15]|nr:MAG: hypothetical protein COV66_09700 [Nitrospinae bacterium CG11_big_fil_rev_8_21_14_0_20_45_15]
MNIILIGYRGTGKSSIARLLARRIQRNSISSDQVIVDQVGKSIPEIVQEVGWSGFRKIESDVIKSISDSTQDGVIDCGGGVPLNDENMIELKKSGKCVLLTADIEAIIKRIRQDPNRPRLLEGMTFEEEQKRILEEREPKYKQAADYICDTTKAPPHVTVRKIVEYFKRHSWI